MKRTMIVCVAVLVLAGCCNNGRQKDYYGAYREASVADIKPQGWLRGLLEAQRDGLGTHRAESGYPYNTCMWSGVIPKGGNPIAQGWWPYEQSGYMVDGLYRVGILLGDSTLIRFGEQHIDYVLDNPRLNGMLGPEVLGEAQWAFSVFVRSLLAAYDATGQRRILDALTSHFEALPDSLTNRQACIIESMCKVYSHTADRRVLDRARKIWEDFSITGSVNRIWGDFTITGTVDNEYFSQENMTSQAPVCVHGVTAAEVSKQAAILYLYTGDERYLDQACGFYASVERDHELADGIPSSYEKLFGRGPELLHETCDVSDFIWSYGYMLMATGDVKWADKIESAFYNAALGSVSKDFCSHQYFSSPNQLVATQYSSVANYGEEGLSRQAYRPGFDVECCSGNVHRMFPAFASRLWMNDNRGGIVAALYAPSLYQATVDGVTVTVSETTEYPFDGRIEFRFDAATPVTLPFTFRVPAWATGATLSVNSDPAENLATGAFHTIVRTFVPGDRVTVELPMRTRKRFYCNGLNVLRGPLLFSVDIAENAKAITGQMKTSVEFPAWDITPASPWNYALTYAGSVTVDRKPVGDTPWMTGHSPVVLNVEAYQVPSWKIEDRTTPKLPADVIQTTAEPVTIKMVPMGSTRIRLTTLPVKK